MDASSVVGTIGTVSIARGPGGKREGTSLKQKVRTRLRNIHARTILCQYGAAPLPL